MTELYLVSNASEMARLLFPLQRGCSRDRDPAVSALDEACEGPAPSSLEAAKSQKPTATASCMHFPSLQMTQGRPGTPSVDSTQHLRGN